MASPAIITTPNTTNLDQPGHVSWRYGHQDGVATPEEHQQALHDLGAGWHSIHTVCAAIGGRRLFRLLAADCMRFVGDDAAGDPVYVLLF